MPDEHRNEVIAAKCTVTVLPFHKASRALHFILLSTALGDTTHLPRYREGTITANGIVLAATARKVRSPIDWTRPTIARPFSLSVPNSMLVHVKTFAQTPVTISHRGTKRRALSALGNVFSGRVIYLPVEMKRK